jgi:hypothetical protein
MAHSTTSWAIAPGLSAVLVMADGDVVVAVLAVTICDIRTLQEVAQGHLNSAACGRIHIDIHALGGTPSARIDQRGSFPANQLSLEEKPALGFVAEANVLRGGRGNLPAKQTRPLWSNSY